MTDDSVVVAAPRRKVRWRYVVVGVLCVGAIAWMITLMQQNVEFFKTVSQAVHDQTHDGTKQMRIGGAVVPHSIKQRGDGVDFQLEEGGAVVTVHHTGNEPPLFKDCAPVVAEGHWAAITTNAPYDSTRLLIKHGNDYKAPANAQADCPKDPFGR